MPNNFVAHGCSFTNYKWPCWPNYVKWFTGGTMLNRAEVGSANETIARRVVESVHKDDPKHIYIMWSGSNRYEMWDERNNIHTGGHRDPEKHKYWVKNFQNDDQNNYRTLVNIMFAQLFLEKHQVPYTMMVWRGDVLSDKFPIYNDIDWSKFVFYKENKGLWEFGEDNFSQYYLAGESHPPPIAHYYWVKDVLFKSDVLCPPGELDKLRNWNG